MHWDYANLGALLAAAAVVALFARRLRLPYTFGLLLAGLGLSFIPCLKEPALSQDLIFFFLPPLIFETAYRMRWRRLKLVLPFTVWLAVGGVFISAAVIAIGLMVALGWSWQPAVLLAILVSPTDPLAVVATLRDLGLRAGMRTILDAESLLNDGTVAVGFAAALAAVMLGKASALSISIDFVWTTAASIGIGAAIAGLLLLIIHRVHDHLVELTFTTLGAYGSFVIAQNLGFSGVLATLVAGLLFGNVHGLSPRARESVELFWEFAAFVGNSCVFLLIGYRLTDRSYFDLSTAAVWAIGLSLVGRAFAVYGSAHLVPPFRRLLKRGESHMLFVGGLRGALSIALALSIPDTLPFKKQILAGVFAIVAFSILVQSLFLRPVLRLSRRRATP